MLDFISRTLCHILFMPNTTKGIEQNPEKGQYSYKISWKERRDVGTWNWQLITKGSYGKRPSIELLVYRFYYWCTNI